ncbi:MAG: DUF559 domain-containing protein [Firmicutes bacterium]|nr:DUF559 domain-containing protein [Alicyclobacillaceae bacterium]MCL6497373.1 DUF559 domain-containing protein [Bacillota bacterium]
MHSHRQPGAQIPAVHPDVLATEYFDSLFEQHVFLRLVERGYRVIPQYRVGDWRIDLVVEGLRARLAVECDGDRWHGPEQWLQDLERQRALERAGWEFVRIRGSAFYRDPEGALAPLWERLHARGIEPMPDGQSGRPAWASTGARPSPGAGEDGVL